MSRLHVSAQHQAIFRPTRYRLKYIKSALNSGIPLFYNICSLDIEYTLILRKVCCVFRRINFCMFIAQRDGPY